MPIEAGILSKQIEKAQKKVEEQNFLIRKRVLEYDDVMNEQRRIVYEYRDGVLEGKDMGDAARAQIHDVVGRLVDEFTPGDYVEEWDLPALFTALEDIWPVRATAAEVTEESWSGEELRQRLGDDAIALYEEREQELGSELMRALERYLLLQIIDQKWREHLYDMDYLREGIHLRGFAQIDPIIAYKNEAFDLFTDLMNTIWADFARMIYHVEVNIEDDPGAAPREVLPEPSRSSTTGGRVVYSGGAGTTQPSALAAAAAGTGIADPGGAYGDYDDPPSEAVPAVQQRRVDDHDTMGRNEACWCGSGKKFKKCHGA